VSRRSASLDELTLDDLNRFLAAQPEDPDLVRYREAAAVLSAFDPFKLKPTGRATSRRSNEASITDLLPLCQPVTQGKEAGLWSMSLVHRRETLRELGTRTKMKAALAANPKRSNSPTQRMFKQLLTTAPLKLEKLSREELAATLEVIDWVEDILDGLPGRERVHQALGRRDLLAPLERLAGTGFVGRERELAQLHDYVFKKKSDVPLFVFGSGGVGKSTLLARFVLDQTADDLLAIAYIDVDRPTILPDKPLTVLLEVLNQLQPQLNVPTGAMQSLVKEITYTLSRYDRSRHLESGSAPDSSWVIDIFRQNFARWLQGRSALVVVDTLEEAQFLGSDVMWPLSVFLFSLHRSLPELRVILSGRTLPEEYARPAFPKTFLKWSYMVEDPALLSKLSLPQRPISVSVLEPAPALQLLKTSLKESTSAAVNTKSLEKVVGLVGSNPMVLKLAARLIAEEGVDKLRNERSELFAKLKAEKIQALLYGRILRHLHNEDVRKVAYPGLIVRRIDAKVIRKVLAKPCKLVLTKDRDENKIFSDLRKEAALVYVDPEDYSLRHRADVRRSMLEDLTDHVRPDVVEAINQAAIKYYRPLPGDIARAEEIYHLLRLGTAESVLDSRWLPGAARHLQGALDEVPAQQRLWLADKLNVTLGKSVRETASQERWESQAFRSANRYLESRLPRKALEVLKERKTRLPRSQLYLLEAEIYHLLGNFPKALAVARAGASAASKAGAIDLALELLLKMVVIEEGRGRLSAAEKLLLEAAATATHSSSEILQFRVKTTELRLQRQLRPAEVDERKTLRAEGGELLSDELIYKLRDHPVLLREGAAELAKQQPQLASAAIETLGVEVATDSQAKAFADAIANSAKLTLKGFKSIKDKPTNAKVIRNWATQVLTRTETKKLSARLGKENVGSKVLDGFRDYFRAGVASTMKVKKF
jgi:hypothetical protein